MISKEEKKEIINKFQYHTADSGSCEVQVAILTSQIEQIAKHLSGNKKDFSALRGLQRLVARRKKLLGYLLRQTPNKYANLIKELGIRG